MRSSVSPSRPVLAGILIASLAGGPARPADLPFEVARPPVVVRGSSGDGYRVLPWPVRPRALRFDAYGYSVPGPMIARAPDQFAGPGGCPPALEPVYDGLGNLVGYAAWNCR